MSADQVRVPDAVRADEHWVGLVLSTLSERLEAALGDDPWALGHRAAALAFASRLIDDDDIDAFARTVAGERLRDEMEILRRYLSDPRDVRGFATE